MFSTEDGQVLTPVGIKQRNKRIAIYVAGFATAGLPMLDLIALFKTILVLGYFGLWVSLAGFMIWLIQDICTDSYGELWEKVILILLCLATLPLIGVMIFTGLAGVYPPLRKYC